MGLAMSLNLHIDSLPSEKIEAAISRLEAMKAQRGPRTNLGTTVHIPSRSPFMQRACGVASGFLSPQIKAGSPLRARWSAPCTRLAAIPTGGKAGASTSQRLAGALAPQTRRHAIPCSESVGRPGQPGTAAIPKDAITKSFASSGIAAITSFVPCPKAYEGGTWDIAKNKSALQGVVPSS